MNYIKPQKLQKGDKIAVISPSWGGPAEFPHIYNKGLQALKDLGLNIQEYSTAKMNDEDLFISPELRAQDINDAFADKTIKAIFCSIGGDDSIRILPYLDENVIRNNPKILIGYSDNTTLLVYCNMLGIVTFHGPTIMAGFSQIESLPNRFKKHVEEILFNNLNVYEYPSYGKFCNGYLDWSKVENVGKTKMLESDEGIKVLQGKGEVTGILFGGCIEILDFMKGTRFYPDISFFQDKLFFLETSEEKPSIDSVRRMLRNYGVAGVFEKIQAIMIGRLRDYSDSEKELFYQMLREVICVEFGNNDIPIIANMDFGHTDPQLIIPLGIKASIDLDNGKFKLNENCLV